MEAGSTGVLRYWNNKEVAVGDCIIVFAAEFSPTLPNRLTVAPVFNAFDPANPRIHLSLKIIATLAVAFTLANNESELSVSVCIRVLPVLESVDDNTGYRNMSLSTVRSSTIAPT